MNDRAKRLSPSQLRTLYSLWAARRSAPLTAPRNNRAAYDRLVGYGYALRKPGPLWKITQAGTTRLLDPKRLAANVG